MSCEIELTNQKLNIILQSGIVSGVRFAISEHKNQVHQLSKKFDNAYTDSQMDLRIGDSTVEVVSGYKALSDHYNNTSLTHLTDKLKNESAKLTVMLNEFFDSFGREEFKKLEDLLNKVKSNHEFDKLNTKRKEKYKQKVLYHIAMLLTGKKLDFALRDIFKLDTSKANVKLAKEMHKSLVSKKHSILMDLSHDKGSNLSKDRRALYMLAKDSENDLLDLACLMMAIIDDESLVGYTDESKYLKNLFKLLSLHCQKIQSR
ncbi:hypothetical protein DMW08_29195 [Vibrio parahaemolyticus]|nr:hypothetical protein [Vibrio parahaemolyticus]EGR2988450.1 hypothetical protein [Vibrio parahaemolyticus]